MAAKGRGRGAAGSGGRCRELLAAKGRTRAAAVLREREAQATVEMAVVTPVLVVLALIVYNLMVFSSAVARFDRVVPDIVIAQGVSPGTDDDGEAVIDASDAILGELEDAMEGYGLTIEVTRSEGDGSNGTSFELVGALVTYTCTMSYTPWPSSFTIAGIDLGAPLTLTHERAVTIDPWRSGVVA